MAMTTSDENALPEELSTLVSRLREQTLEPERVEKVAGGLGPVLDGPVGPPPGGGSGAPRPMPAAASGSGAVKLAAAGLLLAAAGALVFWLAGRSEPNEESTPGPAIAATNPARAEPAVMPPAEPTPEAMPEPSPAALPSAGSAGEEPEREVATQPAARARPSHSARPLTEREPLDLPEEHRLLRSARTALPTTPTRTLAKVREHARRFPSGVLAEEREMLRVSALAAIGRSADARRAADSFRSRWPRSAYARRVEELAAGADGS